MKLLHLSTALLFAFSAGTAQAAEAEDWTMFGRMLSLVQGFLQISAAGGGEAGGVDRHVDGLLAGKSADANRLADDVFADMPGEQRVQVLGVARSLVALGRQQAQLEHRRSEEGRALQARKDLAGMGLSYFDRQQFVDAVKRNDTLAVELYLAGRGVEPRAGLEAARRAGLPEMEQLIAGAAATK